MGKPNRAWGDVRSESVAVGDAQLSAKRTVAHPKNRSKITNSLIVSLPDDGWWSAHARSETVPLTCQPTTKARPRHRRAGLTDSLFEQHGHDLGALVALELDNPSHVLIVDETAVAGEFLCSTNGSGSAASRAGRDKGAQGRVRSLLNAFRSFLGSYSVGTPWRVVIVLRPFLCWIRMWMTFAVGASARQLEPVESVQRGRATNPPCSSSRPRPRWRWWEWLPRYRLRQRKGRTACC